MNKFIRHVKQLEDGGSGVASLAMVTGQRYEDVRKDVDRSLDAFTTIDFDSYLAKHGNAVRRLWHLGRGDTAQLPPHDVNVAMVQGRNGKPHYVVVLHTGDVLDPTSGVLSKLHCYPFVNWVASVHKVTP